MTPLLSDVDSIKLGSTSISKMMLGSEKVWPTEAPSLALMGQFRVANDNPVIGDATVQAQRNRYVILHLWETTKRDALKAADPACKCLVYRNLTRVADPDTNGNVGTGMTKAEATANGWASAVVDADVPLNGVIAKIDVAGYGQAWLTDVLNTLSADPGWDGVFFDDMNATGDGYLDDASWQAAQEALNAIVGPGITQAGYLAVANMSGAAGQYVDFCIPQLPYYDGGLDEFFCAWGGGNKAMGFKQGCLDFMTACLSAGKIHLAFTPLASSSDQITADFGMYMALLGTDQSAKSCYIAQADYTNDPPQFSSYGLPASLGAPLAPYKASGPGYYRDFSGNQRIRVNPTGSTTTVNGASLGAYSGEVGVPTPPIPSAAGTTGADRAQRTSLSFDPPAGSQAGDLLFVWFYYEDKTKTYDLAGSAKLGQLGQATDGWGVAAFSVIYDGETIPTVTWGGALIYCGGVCQRFTEIDSANPINANSGIIDPNSYTTTTGEIGGVTTTVDRCLIATFTVNAFGARITPAVGWTEQFDANATESATRDELASPAGDVPSVTHTLEAAARSMSMMIAIAPAAG